MFTVSDNLTLERSRQLLHVERLVTSHDGALPFSCTLPREAVLGACDVAYNFHESQLTIEQVAEDSTIRLRFACPAVEVAGSWQLSGRSFIPNVSSYTFRLTLDDAIASAAPSEFLQRATIDHAAGVIGLEEQDRENLPLTVDFGCVVRFRSPARSEAEVEQMLSGMPVLQGLAQSADGVFDDVCVIALLHYLDDLLPFMLAMERRGLQPANALLLHKDYPYRKKDLVQESLQRRGYSCFGPVRSSDEATLIGELRNFLDRRAGQVVIIEDGCYLFPSFCPGHPLAGYSGRLLGVVEQTTYGARVAERLLGEMQAADAGAQLPAPYLSVARCEIKTVYEPRFVAEAVCLNVNKLLVGSSWLGRRAIVTGYGSIGHAIAARLIRDGCKVSVVDPLAFRLIMADLDGCEATGASMEEVVDQMVRGRPPRKPDFIIGTTGSQSVGVPHLELLARFDPVLVSASSKQIEFDIGGFAEHAVRVTPWAEEGRTLGTQYATQTGAVRVLGNGFPINFVAAESVANDKIDPILALLHACAAELAAPRVLLRADPSTGGRADPGRLGLPWTRLSSTAPDSIASELRLFDAMRG